jgi:FlaA1/EpsC-like NDP-sugar epimerase
VYVLDMGPPVSMLDLARDMIQLLGYRVGEDVEIRYTGIRPGEKLHESLFCEWERPVATSHEKILLVRDERGAAAPSMDRIDELVEAARRRDRETMDVLLRELVPSYRPSSSAEPEPANVAAADRSA